MKSSFEDKLRNAFETEETQLDLDKLWKKVDQRTFNKPRKKPFLFLFFIFSSLLIGLTVFLLLDEKQPTSEHSIAVEKSSNTFNENSEATKVIEFDKEISAQENATLSSNINAQLLSNIEKSNSIESETNLENKIDNLVTESNSTKSKSNISKSKNTDAKTVELKSNSISNSQLDVFSIENRVEEIELASDNLEMINSVIDKDIYVSDSTSDDKKMIGFALLEELNFLNLYPSVEFQRPKFTLVENSLKQEESTKLQPKKWNHSLAMNTLVGYGLRKLTSRDANRENYIKTRDDLETHLETTVIGLSYAGIHQSNFGFSIGANRIQINERFDWSGHYAKTTQITDSLVRYNVTRIERNLKIYNKYISYNIDLNGMYRISKNNWILDTKLGLTTKLSSKFSDNSMVLSEYNVPISLKSTNGRKIQVTYNMQFSILRKITNRIFIGSTIKYQRIPKIENTSTINQTYNLISAGVKIGYQIG